MNILPNYWS